jgi:hypothetical protein
MKKSLFIIYLVFLCLTLPAQNDFAPIGAKWYYTAPYTGNCIELTSVADTTIYELNHRVIEFRFCKDNSLISQEYFHQRGDSIFYYNYYHESINLLYVFSASVGDTVVVHDKTFKPTKGFYDPNNELGDSVPFFSYRVELIDSIMHNGEWLKRFELNSMYRPNAIIAFHTPIIEKLGATNYIFGRFAYIPTIDNVGLLRCYFDTEFEYVAPTWTFPCDTCITTNIDERHINSIINLYPNPIKKGNLFISAENIITGITLYNIRGEKLLDIQPMAYLVNLDVESLKSGIYILTFSVITKTNTIYKKLIKL